MGITELLSLTSHPKQSKSTAVGEIAVACSSASLILGTLMAATVAAVVRGCIYSFIWV